jgi:hypothetical protein
MTLNPEAEKVILFSERRYADEFSPQVHSGPISGMICTLAIVLSEGVNAIPDIGPQPS